MFAWISLGVVLVSTFTFVLGTFPEFQKEEDTGQPPPYPQAVLVMEVVGKWGQSFLSLMYFLGILFCFLGMQCNTRKYSILIKNSLEFIKAVLPKSFMTSGKFYN